MSGSGLNETAFRPPPNSTSAQPFSSGLAADYTGYAAVGSVVIAINLVTFAVVLSNWALLRRSALIAGITLANLLLGLQLFSSGLYRLIYKSVSGKPPAFAYCLLTVFPLLYPLAFNASGCFLILGGIERFLATTIPNWFRINWTAKNSWLLTIPVCAFVVATMIIGLAWGSYSHAVPLTWNCGIPSMYSMISLSFVTGFSAFAGIFSALFTSLALGTGIRRIRKLGSGDATLIRKQLQITKSMVTISCIDFVLVAVPNFISFLVSFGVWFPSFIRPWNNSYTQGANASVAFFAFLAFNNKFRDAFVKLFHLGALVSRLKKVPWLWKSVQVEPSQTAPLAGNEATTGPVVRYRRDLQADHLHAKSVSNNHSAQAHSSATRHS